MVKFVTCLLSHTLKHCYSGSEMLAEVNAQMISYLASFILKIVLMFGSPWNNWMRGDVLKGAIGRRKADDVGLGLSSLYSGSQFFVELLFLLLFWFPLRSS